MFKQPLTHYFVFLVIIGTAFEKSDETKSRNFPTITY